MGRTVGEGLILEIKGNNKKIGQGPNYHFPSVIFFLIIQNVLKFYIAQISLKD